MDKDKLRDIILEGAKAIACDKCMAVDRLIEFVLAKIPNEVVIAGGIVRNTLSNSIIGDFYIDSDLMVYLEKYSGKSIQLIIREVKK
jgi:hypothetical protein